MTSTPDTAKDTDFLSPKDKKYPYKVLGRVSSSHLRAAIVNSARENRPDVNKRARELFDDHCV